MGDSNSRHLAPKASALPTALIPDLVIEFCARCGQTCGQVFFLTTSACGGSACIAGVSRNCGHGIFWLEGGATRTQIKRDTNFATPGYSLSCHDTTARGKNKVFSICGHLCGQSRFCAAFGNRGKSSKRRCCKALRRFTMPRPGYRHGTPKAGALPTALHPVISLFYSAGRILPKQARYQLRYTRILNDLMGMDPPEATRRRALHTIPVHYNTLAAKREEYSYPFFFAGKTLA